MSKNNKNNSGESTFFLPDISGFTEFLITTEIKHSKHIIEELISLLIENTKKGFQIAEVEGDALFLYQDALHTNSESLMEIAENTFIAFHKYLKNFENLRICSCGACTSAINLSLKFVAHTGKSELASVNGKFKPYGLEVIKAHRLLKNSITKHEYILFSNDFITKFPFSNKHEVVKSSDKYGELGEINYDYILLDELKNNIPLEENEGYSYNSNLKTVISETVEIDAPVAVVYEVLSDFKYRPIWNKGAKIVDHNEDDIYKIGSEHYCIINNKKLHIKTIADKKSKYEFGERIINNGPFKELNLYFIFNKNDESENHSKLTVEIRAQVYFLLKPLFALIAKPMMSKKIHEMIHIIKNLSEEINASNVEQTQAQHH